MLPDPRFAAQPKAFWAHVRSISQWVGYTRRGTGEIKVPTRHEIQESLAEMGLRHDHLWGDANALGELLESYYLFRADALNRVVRPLLMDKVAAATLFAETKERLNFTGAVPMNKQKGDKKAPAFLTGLVNMLVHGSLPAGAHCDFNPLALTTVTKDGRPLRTLSRRVDGAYPSTVNPVAIWEVKEYYYTTTFGSRVADGVYETLLDGMELEELRENEGVDVKHYLILDDHYTWWKCGRSYLCRIIDMLHMGYVDEVIFGREVVDAIPRIVSHWPHGR